MLSNHFLYLGAQGWAHPAWAQDFYPEGLPEDWMLSYYNTQFQAVFLPSEVWQTTPDDDWRNWLNSTQEHFVFIVENSGDNSRVPASDRIMVASVDWLADHVWWLDARPDMRALAACIETHAVSGSPLFIISRSGNLTLLKQAETLRQVMGY